MAALWLAMCVASLNDAQVTVLPLNHTLQMMNFLTTRDTLGPMPAGNQVDEAYALAIADAVRAAKWEDAAPQVRSPLWQAVLGPYHPVLGFERRLHEESRRVVGARTGPHLSYWCDPNPDYAKVWLDTCTKVFDGLIAYCESTHKPTEDASKNQRRGKETAKDQGDDAAKVAPSSQYDSITEGFARKLRLLKYASAIAATPKYFAAPLPLLTPSFLKAFVEHSVKYSMGHTMVRLFSNGMCDY